MPGDEVMSSSKSFFKFFFAFAFEFLPPFFFDAFLEGVETFDVFAGTSSSCCEGFVLLRVPALEPRVFFGAGAFFCSSMPPSSMTRLPTESSYFGG